MLTLDEAQQLRQAVLALNDGVADVGAVEAAHEALGALELQALDDVFAREGVRRGREGHAGHASVAFVQHGERAVFGTEVVAPLAHAMGFVNGEKREQAPFVQGVQPGQEARRRDPLGCRVQQGEAALGQAALHVVGLVGGEAGIEEGGLDARFAQGTHLVVHEGDEG